METAAKQIIAENDYEIVLKDRTNLWDQLRELMWKHNWTSQDVASVSLMQEQDNVTSIFAVRKSDGLLIGAILLIETPDLVYGNIYVMREGYQAAGIGMKCVGIFQQKLGKAFSTKPFIARGIDAMLGKYGGPPFYCRFLYEMFSFKCHGRKAFCDMIPAPATTHNYKVVDVRDLTHRQFAQFCDYDKFITGVDRTPFLRNYYSLTIVECVVLIDVKGEIRGYATISPTKDDMYKVNPIFAENAGDAGHLVKALSMRARSEDSVFVISCRTQSAGDQILKKCRDQQVPLYKVGVLCNAMNLGQAYVDPSKTEFIFAPTNSPVHFDG